MRWKKSAGKPFALVGALFVVGFRPSSELADPHWLLGQPPISGPSYDNVASDYEELYEKG